MAPWTTEEVLDALRSVRDRSPYTRAEVADKLGISVSLLAKMEIGHAPWTEARLESYLTLLKYRLTSEDRSQLWFTTGEKGRPKGGPPTKMFCVGFTDENMAQLERLAMKFDVSKAEVLRSLLRAADRELSESEAATS